MQSENFIFIKHSVKGFVFFASLLAIAACGTDSNSNIGPNVSAKSTSVEWVRHGNDNGEQRFSTLDQIDKKSVKNLGLSWYFNIPTRRGIEATPLMVGRTLYVSGSWSIVYALDAVTGDKKWVYDPKVDRAFLAKGCCDAVNRGVAYSDGKIFVGAYDGRLIALNAKDGSVLWDVQTTDRNESYTITGAPRIAGDNVVIGNGGAELGVRGYVSAYNTNTGKMAWRFYTVPGDPAKGFENETLAAAAKTWNGEWWRWGGGGTVWDAIVYDPALDLLYIGVGNGSPWNQSLRSPAGGDNLFLASIVALKSKTGEYVWHYQTTPGETWDFTATQHIMLADLEIDGAMRKVLMQAPKNGFFYVLDRQTGELISAEPFTSLNWATHVDPKTGRPVETPDARVFDGVKPVLPAMGGGHNWPPMSYNPNTGLVYIPTMQFPATYKQPTASVDSKPGSGYWNLGFDNSAAAPPKLPERELDAVLAQTYSGSLLAWDPIKQTVRWSTPPARPSGGGTLSTAGGLVFQGAHNGHLTAYDAETGDVLWSSDTQTGAMAAPITYAIDGEQYVAIAVGFGGGFGAQGGVIAHGWKIPNISRVLVYKLGASEVLPAAPKIDSRMPAPAGPVTADAATIDRGQRIYQRHCAYCHGDGLRTGGLNPDLRRSTEGIHKIWQQIVRDGIFSSVGMVGFADFISGEEAEAIRQYVLSESHRVYQQQEAQ
ncbi:MAG: PQQ-dependent dehydrogenase, methanol/ethanol family [Pseudomonadales bacterium]|nr:PQQ-dependent dehydrogenase, methanol/ethanol family [Pseudomonadales bacterium]